MAGTFKPIDFLSAGLLPVAHIGYLGVGHVTKAKQHESIAKNKNTNHRNSRKPLIQDHQDPPRFGFAHQLPIIFVPASLGI